MSLNFLSLLSGGILFASTAFEIRAQGIPKPDAVTFIGAEICATNFLRDAFAVQAVTTNKDGTITISTVGTGFLTIGKIQPNGKYMLLGVTCNHVAKIVEQMKAQLCIGFDTSHGYIRMTARVDYADTNNDVCIITDTLPTAFDISQLEITDMAVDSGLFSDSSIVLGRGVLIFGYPLGLGLKGNDNHPIVRFGMVAQNAEPTTFLIDGMASHGNSGSPVFSLESTGTKFLGMITSFENDAIELYDENRQLSAKLPYNSGLSIAVKASVIANAVNEANKLY